MVTDVSNWNVTSFVKLRTLARDIFSNIDYPLLILLLALSCLSLIILYSSGGQGTELLWKQGWRLAIGFVGFIIFASVPLIVYRRWAWLLYAAGLILLIFVLIVGEVGRGSQRWLNLWLLTFQPSEILKFAVPLFLCKIFASHENHPPSLSSILLALVAVSIPVVLVIKQPDLGTSVLICISAAWVIFLAGIRWSWILLFVVLLASMSVPIWESLHEYQRQRVIVFLNPENYLAQGGYHIYQSKVAIGSGGLWGKGWLNGTQSHLGFVPEHSTDFVFSVFAEEFGFIGCCLLILIYLAIIVRGIIITLNAADYFGRLLAGSLTFSFATYFFISVAMVSGLLPVVGVPLPLVSYGGSSVVSVLASFGMLISVLRYRPMMSQRL